MNIMDMERVELQKASDAQADETSEEVAVHIKDQWSSRNECYKLDSFFDQGNNVGQVFQREVSSLIPGIFQGLNTTVFAYGATGNGKTYTMQGVVEQPGLMPLSMSAILSLCDDATSVEVSYYEVYMDRCYDLLEPKAKEIPVLDDKDGRVQLKGLSRVRVQSMSEFNETLASGTQRRKVAHTGLNDKSSRSHGMLTIYIFKHDGSNSTLSGKMNLIDLAGNEDNTRSCNEGIRLIESAKINQSLFALSNVIYALNNNQPRIPYRENKLTRILQDSLGGNSRALMIACLNPMFYREAVHTVSLAARSRQIVNFVSPIQKHIKPAMETDMEEKLRIWLESKGKTKSIQKRDGPCSSYRGKTPIHASSQKKLDMPGSSMKTSDCGVSRAKGRKLFGCELPAQSTFMGNFPCEAENPSEQTENVMGDPSCLSKDMESKEHTSIPDGSDQLKHSTTPPHCGDYDDKEQKNTAGEFKFFDQQKVPHESSDGLEDDNRFCELVGAPSISERIYSLQISLKKGLHGNDHQGTPLIIYQHGDEGDADVNFSTQPAYPLDSTLNKENKAVHCTELAESPTISERIMALQNSLRKVLSPINSNIKPGNHPSSDGKICLLLLEPKTPKTPCLSTCDGHNFQMTSTPLDESSVQSSNLKETFVQKYLEFLNNANKEELLKLKGIGQKRADYILELREETPQPFISLSDLEKIGLSGKQVHDMIRRAARGIFA
ncbi:Kinesin-like protein FLA10 [Acorus calamus]|uniref:Kinesin-like protein n=1 Tax=Acorus calamus TaxID=4465 RepID=A0AAV9F3N1_ACOCL|nr:Kinesin-like protein FLA10 [Acorus calamus]